MKIKHLKVAMVIVLLVAFCAPPCWAKATGYLYVMAYSYRDKVAYCSPIFVGEVRDMSYSDEEFVTEVELLQKIEAAFEKYLTDVVKVAMSNFTVSARGAFKSQTIADRRWQSEKSDYEKKGMAVHDVTDFIFKN
jgi:hypothetical protein